MNFPSPKPVSIIFWRITCFYTRNSLSSNSLQALPRRVRNQLGQTSRCNKSCFICFRTFQFLFQKIVPWKSLLMHWSGPARGVLCRFIPTSSWLCRLIFSHLGRFLCTKVYMSAHPLIFPSGIRLLLDLYFVWHQVHFHNIFQDLDMLWDNSTPWLLWDI